MGLQKIPLDTNWVILLFLPWNVTQALVVAVHPTSEAGLLSDIVVTLAFILSFQFTILWSFYKCTQLQFGNTLWGAGCDFLLF